MDNSNGKVLIMASVASMLDLFNRDNIAILQELGYTVEVAANFDKGSITSQERVMEYKQELKDAGIEAYHIPVPRSIFAVKDILKSYKLTKQLLQQNHYEMLHCHSPIGGVIARLAGKSLRNRGLRVLYTAHGFHFYKGAPKKNWCIFYPIERICACFTDVLITINQEDYLRAKSFKAAKIRLVHGIGLHTQKLKDAKVNKFVKREELGLDENDYVLMSTGQLSTRKNHEVVIRAVAAIKDPSVKYLIVGFGELENKLKILSVELGVSNQIIFAGYRGDVKELLHCVDLFVFPSLQEGLPVALMEAMSCGLPVLCSRIRGNTDLIEDGKGGYIYSCDDVNGFADGIKRMYSMSAVEYRHMSQWNLNKVKEYDITNVWSEMKNIYQEA